MAWRRNLRVLLSVSAVAFALGASAARAQEARAVGVTPPRLSFLDGEVSYWRPGADDWVAAQINTALAAGDSVYTGDGGNVELEIGSQAYLRAGSGTQLGVESLETGYLQLRVPAGHATVDLRRIPEGQEIEVDTPNGVVLINHVGYYRVDVDDESTRFSARRGGIARVVAAGSDDQIEIGSSQQVVLTGTETAQIQRVAAAGDDAWDRWNYDRTAGLSEAPRSAQYVSPEVAGVDDLDRYGDWRETPSYGHVWMPRQVAADWSPYSTGRWVWDGYYGWTWVDDQPWGWAPYHYGRWCQVDGSWGWAPGPVVARPVYSPALVAFFGGPHGGVTVSVGTPFVSWVPLGWGEPVVPWWGPRGFVGRPYWGGWGGPRVVNNVVVNNTTIINVNNINRYDNSRYRDAVRGVDGDRFGRGRITPIRVDAERVRNMRPVRGELGVRPVSASLVPREGRGTRPPDRIQNRRVVATRVPQDPARMPRAAGLVRTDVQRRPEPRIVAPRTDRVRGEDRVGGRTVPPPRGNERGSIERGSGERAPGDRGTVERGSIDRGHDVNERRAPEARSGTTGGSNDTGRIERIPGNERGGTRGAPQPPSNDTRTPRERSGRDTAGTPEQRGGERAATPPTDRMERGQPAERTRGANHDDVPPPPRRIETPRDDQRQPGHTEPPERAPRNDAAERAPRMEQHAPAVEQHAPATEQHAPRMEQPERAPRSNGGERPDRAPRDEASRQVAPSHERVEQPRREPQREQPRQRTEVPPSGGRQETVDWGKSAQHQAPPRQQPHQPPRVERGGGEARPAPPPPPRTDGGGGHEDARHKRDH